jgi:hypothetical protein
VKPPWELWRTGVRTSLSKRSGARLAVLCAFLLGNLLSCDSVFGEGILEIRNGYFWDPVPGDYFIARGFAYQTFNPPVGANQTFEQLEYDLAEFKKMHANSVRAEFVWNTVEIAPSVFDWSKPDFLVAKAEELGLKLFVLIGFQYAPTWFPNDWKATNDAGAVSVVLNYEHPGVRQVYSNYIYQVASRYRDSTAIGGWILGNEYAYFDLWNPDRRYLGFDPLSSRSFQTYLAITYNNNVATLNSNWKTSYSSFEDIQMPRSYPSNRNSPAYYDLIQWRKKSIGDYVALGAIACRLADTRHLRTYSMVGGLFGEADANFTCEDARTIVRACVAARAPLDFWSINNYAIAALDSELRSTDYGIHKHQVASGLPVLETETGHTSTENLHPNAGWRQAAALPGQLWEALISGAMGVHLFTWNERDLFSGDNFPREKGFGIVRQSRLLKEPAYGNVLEAFRRMEQIDIGNLVGGTTNPPPDVQLFWSQSSDMGWPRANHENLRIWSTLKRLGFQPKIIHDQEFESGAWTNAPALLLSRCYQMDPRHLDIVVSNVIPAGKHVHASADLPGQYDAYRRLNPQWARSMAFLFGLDVSRAFAVWDAGSSSANDLYRRVNLGGVQALGSLTNGYADYLGTWKIWSGLANTSGSTIVQQTGIDGSAAPVPALQIKMHGAAKTALQSFAIGDIVDWTGQTAPHSWDLRYAWLRAIYRDHFGMRPSIDLTGPGASYVIPDYRICRNGSVLISLLNGHTNSAAVTLTASNLLKGRTVENLATGGIMQLDSDGGINLNLSGDEYVLLYAYDFANGVDQSLLNSSPNKLWIKDAPAEVWPTGSNYGFSVGYDLRDPNLTLMASFERVLSPNLVYAQTNAGTLSGTGTITVPLLIPEADLDDPWYVSSRDGGDYVFHAWLVKNGARVADTYLPVRLAWAVRPLSLPDSLTPGATYPITVNWQELPSYLSFEDGAPMDRARLWQPYLASQQYYKVVLELRSAGQIIATQEFLTNTGTDQHTFTMTVPSGAAGPFTWSAHLQTVPGASIDMVDSFEDRDTGANSSIPITDPALFAPWQLQTYAENTEAAASIYFDSGVGEGGSDRNHSVFVVLTNPPTVGAFSGAFLAYTYPEPWALPRDRSQWTNYTFAFDLKEDTGLSCVLEMQVKDIWGGLINYTKFYTNGGWDTIKASVAQFTGPSWLGHFDSEKVSQLLVNVQLLQTNVVYLISLDNVRFIGPKRAVQTTAPLDLWDGFDDRTAAVGMGGWAALAPWSPYLYPSISSHDFDRGVTLFQGINGGSAAMVVVTNPASVGANSGFGLYRSFPNTWSLPQNKNAWSNYVFSYSFREETWKDCSIEMQVKSGDNNWIEFKKPYAPGTGGWDTVRASLDQFHQPAGVGRFDPKHVQGIALNIRTLEKKVTYVGFFDDIYFDAPDTIVPSGTRFGFYQSINDSVADDTPVIQSIEQGDDGQIVLSWMARSNRLYSVEYQDAGPDSVEYFLPLIPLTSLTVPTDGLLRATDTNVILSPARFYRVRVQPR